MTPNPSVKHGGPVRCARKQQATTARHNNDATNEVIAVGGLEIGHGAMLGLWLTRQR